MKKWFIQLNNYYKVSLLTFITALILVVGCIPFYFIDLQEIPQGLLLGALVGIVPYVLLGTIEKGETNKKSSKGAIILSISRFVLIAIALTLSATAYYYFDLKIFNIFAVLGGYLLTVIWLFIIVSIGKKNGTI